MINCEDSTNKSETSTKRASTNQFTTPSTIVASSTIDNVSEITTRATTFLDNNLTSGVMSSEPMTTENTVTTKPQSSTEENNASSSTEMVSSTVSEGPNISEASSTVAEATSTIVDSTSVAPTSSPTT